MKYILILFALMLIGCDDPKETGPWIAHVESNTSWSGYFGNASVDGVGNKTITMGDSDVECCAVQKLTPQGSLSVWIEGGESGSTTAAYGMVTVCGSR
jgi:hypothetical protein